MARTHQKKRNSALMYEFLVAAVSSAIVQDDKRTSSRAVRILRRRFRPGTELHKELRIIAALHRGQLLSEAVAVRALSEAKERARALDGVALDREKSLLIKEVNASLNDPDFYDRHVDDYRMLATLQTLVNDWRDPAADIQRVVVYEDQAVRHMLSERVQRPDDQLDTSSTGTGRLLLKVMMRRLNERYSHEMDAEQKAIVKAYAFATANDDPGTLRMRLETVRDSVIGRIDEYSAANPNDAYVCGKLQQVRERILSEDVSSADDSLVVRFMQYSRLSTELGSVDSPVNDEGTTHE